MNGLGEHSSNLEKGKLDILLKVGFGMCLLLSGQSEGTLRVVDRLSTMHQYIIHRRKAD